MQITAAAERTIDAPAAHIYNLIRGRMLIESDAPRRMLTTFTVDPEPYGRTRVRIHTRWYTDGLAGLTERLVAPRLFARVYREELSLLDRYARGELAVAGMRAMPWASAR